jgi:hypothetical protein
MELEYLRHQVRIHYTMSNSSSSSSSSSSSRVANYCFVKIDSRNSSAQLVTTVWRVCNIHVLTAATET